MPAKERLNYEGEFYNMSLLPRDWAPKPHDHEMKLDVSAVGPLMTKVAGEVADGIHVHPLHSMHYIENRLYRVLRLAPRLPTVQAATST